MTGVCGAVYAQAPFPGKPLRIMVPSAAGGAMDAITRIVSTRLSDALGQPVVVDNRGGANGAIAAEITARAPPDGYTVMLGGNGNLAINPWVHRKLAYDPLKDFAAVTSAALGGHVLVVHPALPVHNVKEFIALAKSQPGQLSYGVAGVGSSQHLTAVLLQRISGIKLLQVPYRGGAPATADLVAGQTQVGFPSTSTAATFVNQGRLRALAATTQRRLKAFPKLPTMAEAGVPGFEAYTWYGFVVASKTPQPVIARLNKDIVQVLNHADSIELLGRLSMESWTGAPEAFAAHVQREHEKWGRIVREAGVAE